MRLEAKNITVRYGARGSSFTAVDAASFMVEPSTPFGIVGESGSGKSSLARALVGFGATAGEIFVDGQRFVPTAKADARAIRTRLQLVLQDPSTSFNPRLRLRQSLVDALHMSGRRRHHRGALSKTLGTALELVGLHGEIAERFPHQVSGGQLQRASIARALLRKPDILVADEITSALDVSVQARIMNLLIELRQTVGLNVIFISHDLSLVRGFCQQVAVMQHGKIVEAGQTSEVLTRPSHPYTQLLISSTLHLPTKSRAKSV